jgi:hypothetical protein
MIKIKYLFIFCVVLLLYKCSSTVPLAVYLPQQTAELKSFYRNGLPLGVIKMDSSIAMVLLEPVTVVNKKYMRLWFLYKNNSNSEYLLEPMKCLKLNMEKINDSKKHYDNISPESPTKILADIENAQATATIFQVIGGTLEAMSTKPTKVTDPKGKEWTIDDRDYKKDVIINRTGALVSATETMYDIFKQSVNTGILRRNTVFPGESINGFVYFPVPQVERPQYQYRLQIFTQYEVNVVNFVPAAGE